MRVEDKPKTPTIKLAAAAARPLARRRFSTLTLRIGAERALTRLRADPFHPLLDEQDRWFIWIPVAMAVGVAAYFTLPAEPYLPMLSSLAAVAVLAAWRVRDAPVALACLGVLAAIMAGLALASYEAHRVWRPAILASSGPVTLTGTVTQTERRGEDAVRYTLRVEALGGFPADATPEYVTVTRRGGEATLAAGTRVRMRAILLPPPEPAMPGGFDFARRAYFERIGGVGFALASPRVLERRQDDTLMARASALVERLRETMAARIRTSLPGARGEVASALIAGKRGGIPEETTRVLRAAGLQHVLAISGLHMMLVAGTVFVGMRMLLAAIPGLALTRPVRKHAAVAALAVAAFYLCLSGAAISAQRAFIMTAILFAAVLMDRPAITLRNVALAAIAIIVMTPSAVLQAGFQMSFAATAALVGVYETLRRRRLAADTPRAVPGLTSRIRFAAGAVVLTALVAGLATTPFAAFHFNRVAPYGLLGNVLAMPVVSFVVMPFGVLSGSAMALGLESWPLQPMGWGIALVERISAWVAGLPHAEDTLASFGPGALATIALALFWAVIWRGRWRYAGAGVLLACGLVLAAGAGVPQVLVGRDGALAAIRGADGQLVFAARRKSAYVIETWLRRTGDPRSEAEGLEAVSRCRDGPCRAETVIEGGQRIVVSVQMPGEALSDTCHGADIAVLSDYAADTADCAAGLVITPEMLERRGALAITVVQGTNGTDFSVTGARDHRSRRIWSRQ